MPANWGRPVAAGHAAEGLVVVPEKGKIAHGRHDNPAPPAGSMQQSAVVIIAAVHARRRAPEFKHRFNAKTHSCQLKLFALIAAGLLGLLILLAGIAAAVIYPNLPDISELTDYQPKQPLRVYTADEVQIGEYGSERRKFLPLEEIPKLMQDALLATEDADFYEHGALSYTGIARALLTNMLHGKAVGGASTITQQLARTFYLTRKKHLLAQVHRDAARAQDRERADEKEILEIYMNQIYLGQKAYGFEGRRRHLLRQEPEGAVRRRDGDAGRPAAEPGLCQPGRQLRARNAAPVPGDRADAGHRRDHAGPGQGGTQREAAHPQRAGCPPPRRICRRDGAPARLREIRRRELYPRPEGLHDAGVRRAGGRLPRAAPQPDGLRAPQALPRPEGFVELPAAQADNAADIDAAIAQALSEHPDDDELRSAVVTAVGAPARCRPACRAART